MDEPLRTIISKLFDDIKDTYATTSTISDALLTSLQDIFQGSALSALDLVEHAGVTVYTSPSGRKLYSVIGSANTPYLIPYAANYCPCYSFQFRVLQQEMIQCKHLLAIRLCRCMGLEKTREVTNEVMVEMINDMVALTT